VTTLAELPVGRRAVVREVDSAGAVGSRLLEMGLTPGVDVCVLGTAPLGDPLEIELRGYRLSLRRSEAQRVTVDPPVP
jgi:Fe2+ transport system protein FeoA